MPDEDTFDDRGIRIIADAMLSDSNGAAITNDWTKVHSLRPRVRVPISSCDEDWSESFNHWGEHSYKQVGVFFAGSALPFNCALGRTREAFENLGLKAIYDQGELGNYVRTDIVRGEHATWFQCDDSMCGKHYSPPLLNSDFLAEILAEELRRFYASLAGGAFILAPGQPKHGSIQYDTKVGLAGYCEASQQFRIFHLTPKEDFDSNGIVKPVPKIVINEVRDCDMLLIGSQQQHQKIQNLIETEFAASEEPNRQDCLSKARQTVVEREILSGEIPGVGGSIIRAEVTNSYGFNFVDHPWAPREKLDFSCWYSDSDQQKP